MANTKGLGKGLSALLGDDVIAAKDERASSLLLPISQVESCSTQPRKSFEPEALSDLADSIRIHGIIQPLTVRKLQSGYYQIIAGERRWRAARMAGLTQVPVVVIEADDRKAMELAMIENLQREDLNPIEEAEGYRVLSACNGKEALAAAAREDVHLILMDIMMPVMDGLSAMAQLRQTSNVPVILLTAKGEDTDKVLGLNVGADDYITKPFNPVELLARVRSQLRRYLQLGGGQVQASTLIIGGICLDDNAKTVTVDGDPVALTPKEYDILRFLMRNAGTVFSPNEIYRRGWEDVPLNAAGAIAVHIRHLREKLEINPSEPRYIKVVWGKGYKMEGGVS